MKTVIRPETEMKESGASWMGKIPCEWSVSKLKWYLRRIDPRNPGDKQVLSLYREYGVIPKDSRDDNHNATSEDTSKYKYVRVGDFVVNKMKAWQGSVAVSEYDGIVSPAYYVYHFTDDSYHRRYFHYLLRSCYKEEFMRLSGGIRVGQWDLSSKDLDNVLIVIPKKEEQQAIADYLDETCSKIDEIIAEAKASVDEYKELKQAVIFDGISLGTKSCCEYKKTTLEGIKKIPVAWEYRKLKFLIKYIESGVSVNAGNEPATELEYGVLKTSCVSKMFFIPSENKSVNKDEYARVKCPVCGNTIIVSRMNTPDLVGACAYIEKNINNIFLPDRLWQVHFNDDVNVKYVYYCLISPYIRNYYSSLSTGTSSSMQNISQGQFANAIIPYPSLEEQKEIVEFLDKRTAEIDSLIAEKESLIHDLEAYKKSLIYEVVTGKRRVV